MESNQKPRQFFYHPRSCDNNGNGGPSPSDKGWRVVIANDEEGALEKLPPKAKAKVTRILAEYEKKRYETRDRRKDALRYEPANLTTFLDETCGWGVGFTLVGEDDWAEMRAVDED